MEFIATIIGILFMVWLGMMFLLLVLSAILNVKRAADRTFDHKE